MNLLGDRMEYVNIFGVKIFNIDFQEAINIANRFLKEDRNHSIITPNTEIVMAAKDDEELRDIINGADLVIPDGIGLIYGSKMRGHPLKERVTGYDVSMELLKILNEIGGSLYMLGGKPGVTDKAEEKIKKDYENINIVGHHHGYFKGIHRGMKGDPEELEIIEEINSLKPDIIFLGLGFPKQEMFINEYKDKLNSKIIIGNGGVMDILAGNMKRAPEIFIKLHLEWFYRLLKEPSRIKRQVAIPKFIFEILKNKDSVKVEEDI